MPEIDVCLTGGGTAGHVTPHFALVPGMKARGWGMFYVGGAGLEKPLVEAQGIAFKTIATGKLRRYLSLKNLVDLFKIAFGLVQALLILIARRPSVVFSKGGFVSVPVAWAAWLLRIPVVSHESDVTPGLATKLIAPLAKKIVFTFAETAKYLPANAERVGTPVRAELFAGDRAKGLALCGFDPSEPLPTWLVMGGSQGSQRLNDALLAILPELAKTARVIHLTGKGKTLAYAHPRYRGFEFVTAELPDLYAASDLVLSRAGANSIFEFLALRKPMLLIPLEIGSRGDQVVNAASFVKSGWAEVLRETELTAASLAMKMGELEAGREGIMAKQQSFDGRDAAEKILGVLEAVARPPSAPR